MIRGNRSIYCTDLARKVTLFLSKKDKGIKKLFTNGVKKFNYDRNGHFQNTK